MSTYLGLDASTQSLTAILIEVADRRAHVVFERTFTYDQELPSYRTTHGVIRGDDPAVVVADPAMWAEALDRMIGHLVTERPAEMARLAAIAGSAQQHGSVYLNERAPSKLVNLDPRVPLATNVAGLFSRRFSPVWMDSSTTAECREITAAVGGDAVMAARTGSRVYERFAGPQIRKFFKTLPDAYEHTARIHLISSFMASLLAGADAPVDPGDGSGMSLLDLTAGAWWPAAVEATAPGLAAKLPAVAASSAVIGPLARYWRDRYRLPPARVIVWSGDNTCSLIGTGLVTEGHLTISLGTSDTIFGLMREPRVSDSGIGHVFGAPTGDFMGITVFKNGSLARERVRDAYGMNWAAFSRALQTTPAGNGGALMLPWFDPEITPHVGRAGVHRLHLADDDGPRNVRAVVEAQMMSMANHSRWMGVDITTIHATGGASGNRDVLRVMSDVFDADVYQFPIGNSACLGAALRAWHADAQASGAPVPWTEIVAGVAEPLAATRVSPVDDCVAIYRGLRGEYAAFEAAALQAAGSRLSSRS